MSYPYLQFETIVQEALFDWAPVPPTDCIIVVLNCAKV